MDGKGVRGVGKGMKATLVTLVNRPVDALNVLYMSLPLVGIETWEE